MRYIIYGQAPDSEIELIDYEMAHTDDEEMAVDILANLMKRFQGWRLLLRDTEKYETIMTIN